MHLSRNLRCGSLPQTTAGPQVYTMDQMPELKEGPLLQILLDTYVDHVKLFPDLSIGSLFYISIITHDDY